MVKPADFLQAPIPLQSLTETPKTYAWESPPEIVEEADAIKYYIDKLADPDVMDDLAVLFDGGMAISPFVDALTTTAVSEGKHTIDMKLLVSPVVHAFLKAAMLQYGIDAKDDGYDPKTDRTAKEKRRLQIAIDLALAEAQKSDKTSGNDAGVSILEEVRTNLQEEEAMPESEMAAAEETKEMPEPPKGLMAREAK